MMRDGSAWDDDGLLFIVSEDVWAQIAYTGGDIDRRRNGRLCNVVDPASTTLAVLLRQLLLPSGLVGRFGFRFVPVSDVFLDRLQWLRIDGKIGNTGLRVCGPTLPEAVADVGFDSFNNNVVQCSLGVDYCKVTLFHVGIFNIRHWNHPDRVSLAKDCKVFFGNRLMVGRLLKEVIDSLAKKS